MRALVFGVGGASFNRHLRHPGCFVEFYPAIPFPRPKSAEDFCFFLALTKTHSLTHSLTFSTHSNSLTTAQLAFPLLFTTREICGLRLSVLMAV